MHSGSARAIKGLTKQDYKTGNRTEQKKQQYEDVLKRKDKSAEASVLASQMVRVIRWNIPGLYQQNAQRLLKNN